VKLRLVAPGVLLASGLVLHPIALSSSLFVLAAGGVAVLGFSLALVTGWWSLGGTAAGLFVAQYAVAIVLAPTVDLLAPLVAMGLLVLLELIDVSRVMTRRREVESEAARRHARDTAVTASLGGIAATAVTLAGIAGRGGGAPALVVGAACMLGAVAVAVAVAKRGPRATG
jgi:hypothetical protein